MSPPEQGPCRWSRFLRQRPSSMFAFGVLGVHWCGRVVARVWALLRCVGVGAAKGRLSRKGCGEVAHRSSRQMRVQGAFASRGIVAQKMPQDNKGAPMLTHPCSVRVAQSHFAQLCLGRRLDMKVFRPRGEQAMTHVSAYLPLMFAHHEVSKHCPHIWPCLADVPTPVLRMIHALQQGLLTRDWTCTRVVPEHEWNCCEVCGEH